jgi:hypothetical protein
LASSEQPALPGEVTANTTTAPVGAPEVERGIEFVGDDVEPKGVVVTFTAN